MIRPIALALALAFAPVAAQLSYGDPLPGTGTTGSADAGLTAAAGSAGLVVVFTSNACPWVDRYAPRLADLADRYGAAGIGFLLVNSNDPTRAVRANAEGAQAWAERLGISLPYLFDTDGTLATAFGATHAPHTYFFGPQMTLLYDGAIDDSPAAPDRVETPYLELAMDQSIASLPIEIQRTQAFGCSIKRTPAE